MKFLHLSILFCAISIACTSASRIDRVASSTHASSTQTININTASANELEQLPGVGETLAGRIVEFRTTSGPFRRPEYLMLVDGVSEKKFKEIRAMIRVE
jgi:competence protein ComEA